MFSAMPASLIFTADGIRITEPRFRVNIVYDSFRDYAFSFELHSRRARRARREPAGHRRPHALAVTER
jgi:hypothetical protein